MAVSLGTVFMLNSLALFLFPAVWYALHLTQTQFGLWSALAIHDTSSVVRATAKYGSQALTVGTTIKLARVLWIVPVVFAMATLKRSKSAIKWPWFILLFCLAAVAGTYVRLPGSLFPELSSLGKAGLTVTLYLIGTGISKSTLKQVGRRSLIQGILLWAIVAIASFCAIASTVWASSASGTTCVAIPSWPATGAEMGSPSIAKRDARPRPTRSARRCSAPAAGTIPAVTSTQRTQR
jgi:uncharacterized membrane protein YadS